MKKIILLLLTVVSFSTAYGQATEWHIKQNDHFVNRAAEEYNLSDTQKEELSVKRMKMVNAYFGSIKKYKAGEISFKERKEITIKSSREFNSYFGKLVGGNYTQIAPFLKRMREEQRRLK